MSDNTTAHSSNEYDLGILKTIPFYNVIHSEIINLVKVYNGKPDKWLDTGCGTGTFIVNAQKTFMDTKFFLCDPSIEMLNIALNKCINNTKSIGFLDTISIDKKWNNQFDIVTAIQCLHYLDKKGRADSLARCFDILKNDGMFVTFENTRPLTQKGERLYKDYWKQFQIQAGKEEKKAESHIQRFDVEYFPISVIDHIELLKKTGFRTVELFWYSYMQSGYVCIK